MARRRARGKRKTRRTPKKGPSILALAEAGMIINTISNGLFNQGMIGFLVPSMGAAPTINVPYGSKNPVTYSGGDAVSLNELWQPVNAPGDSFTDQVTRNFKKNWGTMAFQLIAIPTAFRVGKMLARPGINQANRLLRQVKLERVVSI